MREPRPADWGFGMTICIAAFCHASKSLILACDSMVTTSDMSADPGAVKILPVSSQWMTMFAGNDISVVTPIMHRMDNVLLSSLDDVSGAFRVSFAAELMLRAQDVLMPLGFTVEEFKEHGLERLGADTFSRLLYQMENQQIEVEFLVAGFEEMRPYIFTVQHPGKVNHYSELGFWAIGSGQTAALGSLFNQKYQVRFLDENAAIYRVIEAKFNAENAVGVGERTILLILRPDGSRTVAKSEDIEMVRPIWDKTRTKTVPTEGLEKVNKLLEAAKTHPRRSASQKSEKAQ